MEISAMQKQQMLIIVIRETFSQVMNDMSAKLKLYWKILTVFYTRLETNKMTALKWQDRKSVWREWANFCSQ